MHAGGWLGLLGQRFGSYRLREVMRQRDPRERRLLERLHAGEPEAYLREKQTSGLLRLYEGDDNAGTVRLRTDAGSGRALPAFYCAQHLEHAYALTAPSAQGATMEWAAVVGNPDAFQS